MSYQYGEILTKYKHVIVEAMHKVSITYIVQDIGTENNIGSILFCYLGLTLKCIFFFVQVKVQFKNKKENIVFIKTKICPCVLIYVKINIKNWHHGFFQKKTAYLNRISQSFTV